MKRADTIAWDDSAGCIRYIDQTKLPGRYIVVECTTVRRLATAIRRLEVRGAPALGVAGAFGIALAAAKCKKRDTEKFLEEMRRNGDFLISTRPTAINLSWGVNRVIGALEKAESAGAAKTIAMAEAQAVAREDEACCHAIGEHGTSLLPQRCTVLTHCNAGALACKSWGTALGVIRSAAGQGKDVKVIACETRPLFQGARLTAWELLSDGIDVTVITDSMAAHLMRTSSIDCVVVGADRITRDAVFNKIGTYMHAVCARYHGIPFYVAAPISTFDSDLVEKEVMIEERSRDEVARCGTRTIVPERVKVKNPAFDATPMELVTAVITERGVLHPPIDMKALTYHRTIR
ncbi:MAG: S-methyl-5-thioribose-1-phosphate isomerase [Methanoregula sp.]|nr:MAG: S-methyl-5-thioribose-1-phosphate isomerase [Methanoregula sp.]